MNILQIGKTTLPHYKNEKEKKTLYLTFSNSLPKKLSNFVFKSHNN